MWNPYANFQQPYGFQQPYNFQPTITYKSDSDCQKIVEEVKKATFNSDKLKALEKWLSLDNNYLQEAYIVPLIKNIGGNERGKAAEAISKCIYNIDAKTVYEAMKSCTFESEKWDVLTHLSKNNVFDISGAVLIAGIFTFNSDKTKAEDIIVKNKK